MTAPPQATTTSLVLVLFVILLVVRRTIATARGARLRPSRLAVYSGFVVFVFVLTLLAGITAVPWYTLPIDAAVGVAAGFAGVAYTRRRVKVHEAAPGVWIYRLGWLIPLVYAGLFATRLALDLFLLDLNPFGGSLPSASVSSTTVVALAVVDALFALSTGLLVGRNIGVFEAYRRVRTAPLPSS